MGAFFHRHPGLTPYLLLAPGLLWLGVFFLVPLGFLGYQSLQSGIYPNFEFTWEFSNFSEAFSDYRTQLGRSFLYAALATTAALLLAYPLVYWIAFRSGTWRNFFLLLIVAPFFVSYLIRTLAWLNILADEGPVVGFLQTIHVLGEDGRLLATTFAVVAGITYNFLPFMALPIYVSLEQIEPRLLEAAKDLYAIADADLPARDAAALGAGDRGGHAAHVHPRGGRLHQRRAPRHAEPGHDRQRHPGEVPRIARLPDRGIALVHPHGDDPRRPARLREGRRLGEAHRMNATGAS